jgi:O-antigen/teichoic acid export membrane protein
MVSLKNNILANYVSQMYVTLIGIVTVPLYIKYMGAEAYGLVGFFALMQAFFTLLDMGLTNTISRETARLRGGVSDALIYRRLVRALEGIFLVIALLGGGILFAASGYIAQDWLQAKQLPIAEVETAIQIMAALVALRWMCGLYRGAITGAERLVWLGGYNSLIATLRFIGVLPVLMFVGATPTIFFSYQFAVATLEYAGFLFQAYRLFPAVSQSKRLPWSWTPLKPVLKFSLTIAATTSLWMLTYQTDKLALSKLLPLSEYGYFTLAVLIASTVGVVSGPIVSAIQPRMAKLEAEGDHASLIRLYRHSTQVVAVIAGSLASTFAFFSEPLLWAWTGDINLAHQAAPILILYAIGNCFLAVSAFQYYLQFAKGDLRLSFIGQCWYTVLIVPSIIWAANQFGAIGSGYVWIAINILFFVVWVPLVHRRFVPDLNKVWFGRDVLPILIITATAAYFLFLIMPQTDSRWWQLSMVTIAGLLVMLAGALASPVFLSRAKLLLTQEQLK